MLVCFDTNMLIWGVQGVSTLGQEGMIQRTKKYIKQLNEIKAKIILPTPVVAEYLTHFDDESRKKHLLILQEAFRIVPFDLPAAVLAAAIQSRRDLIKGIQADYSKSRISIKTDCLIIAIAKVAGADKIISHDEPLRKLAMGYVNAIDVPDEIPEQKKLNGFEE